MMKKKMFFAAAILSAAALIVSGCGNDKKKDVSSSQDVVWYMPKTVSNLSHQAMVEEAANRLIGEKLDVRLKFKLIDSSMYDQKMNVIVSSGESYDICFTTSWTNNYFKNVKQNAFLDISGLLDEYGKDIIEKSDKGLLEKMKMNGKLYAIPSQNPFATPTANTLKKELVEKYNFDYKNAHTLRDYEPWLEQIKKNEPGITPILSIEAPTNKRYNDDSIPGLRYDEQEGKFVKYFDIPEVIDDLRTRSDFYKKGYFAKDAATQKDYLTEAKSGKYAVMQCSYYTEDGSKSTATYGFECVDSFVSPGLITTPGVMVAMNAIGINSKHPEKAMQLLNLIWKDPEISNTLAYGVEGVDYQVDTKNTAEKTVIPNTGDSQKWAMWHNWLGPLWDQWNSSWNSTESLKEMQYNNEHSETSSIFGFIFDSTPVKTEYSQVSAAHSEFKDVLANGAMPDFDEYMAKVNTKFQSSGIDKLLEEANRQLEQWKKEQK